MTMSRGAFGRLLGTAGAAAALPLPALADATRPAVATGPVRLNYNENPFGPSPAALEAAKAAFGLAGRYPDDLADQLIADIAKHHGITPKQVVLGAGSGEILKWAAVTFTGPGRPLVQADPTFEALGNYTRTAGGEVRAVPLNERHEHDLPRMAELARHAALVYLCNPNNPTATITPDAAVRPFVEGLPAAVTVLVDEAYHHYVTSRAYASVMDPCPAGRTSSWPARSPRSTGWPGCAAATGVLRRDDREAGRAPGVGLGERADRGRRPRDARRRWWSTASSTCATRGPAWSRKPGGTARHYADAQRGDFVMIDLRRT